MLDLKKLDKIFKEKGLSYENDDGTKKPLKEYMEQLIKIWTNMDESQKEEFRKQYEEQEKESKKQDDSK